MTHSLNQQPLTPDGPVLSRVVAGAWRMADWNMTPRERLDWIHACLDAGVTTFDHADIYGGYTVEALFGEALALEPGLRGRLQLVTKCGIKLRSERRPAHAIKSYDVSGEHIVRSAETSLRNLRTDVLDVLLIHRPSPLLHAEEVAEAFTELRNRGLVRAFGVSNFTPAQYELLHAAFPLVTNQIELSPFHLAPLHDGTLDQLQRLRVAPMIWSPLAGGRLFTEDSERAGRVRRVLGDLAGSYGTTPAGVVYAWILKHPTRPLPITGSRRVEVIQEAAQALSVRLSDEDWFRVWEAAAGQEVP